jgi:hypothetical protein
MRVSELTMAKGKLRRGFLPPFLVVLLLVLFWALGASAQQGAPVWNIVKPSTTGVPGDEVRVMAFDPDGNLWIGTRDIFWQEWGVAMLPKDQLDYHPLPGGGYDTGAWKVWSTVHGHPLPSEYMYDMEFSSDGTMWLATEEGLTRFRPNATNPADKWFTYTTSNSPLVLNDIRSLALDGNGNLWISNASLNYAYSYLFKLNASTGVWTQIATGGHQPFEVAIGNNDRVLISMKDVGGVMEFDGNSWAQHPTDARELGSLVQDAQGNIWAAGSGISGDGLWKWNGSSWQNWPQVGGTITVTGIGKDRNGVVYVSTWYGGIYKMINDEPVFFAAADNIPRSIIGRPNGDIWINNYGGNGTLGTVRHYTPTGQLLTRMQIFNAGLPDYFVDRITRDSAGNMWFATGEGGLTRMQGSDGSPTSSTHWRNFGNHNDQAEPYPWSGSEPMYSLFEDTGGIFWMGGNGVGRWDSVTGQFTNFWNSQNSNIDASGVKSIVKREGTMWVGTGGSGVSWLNGNDWTRVLLSPTNYDANYVNAMTVDIANNVWVASNYGLRRFAPGNNKTFTEYFQYNSPLPSDYILDLMPDPSGGIWIGTTAGLVRFDGTNWTIFDQANTGMPGISVTGIARRPSDGLLAVASIQPSVYPYTGGVSTFDGNNWAHYTPQNSPLPHWQVVAVEFDINGNLWASPLSNGVVQIMIGNNRHAPFDFDADGKTDISIFRPSLAQWWYTKSSDAQVRAATFGSSTDVITPADFSGDGKTDLAFFRSSTGEWFVLRSEDGSFYSFPFGTNGDIPMPGDYDSDGKADAAVFRPGTGTWYISRSSDSQVTITRFGSAGDRPVARDYDGDGRTDIAIVRDNAGSKQWWIQRSTAGLIVVNFGQSGDNPVPGDYTGDGRADAAVWRPVNGNWYVLRSEDLSYYSVAFGQSGDIPAPGDYDGDGKFDASVFRPSVGTWFVARSTAGTLIVGFGTSGDRPVPNAFVP